MIWCRTVVTALACGMEMENTSGYICKDIMGICTKGMEISHATCPSPTLCKVTDNQRKRLNISLYSVSLLRVTKDLLALLVHK